MCLIIIGVNFIVKEGEALHMARAVEMSLLKTVQSMPANILEIAPTLKLRIFNVYCVQCE